MLKCGYCGTRVTSIGHAEAHKRVCPKRGEKKMSDRMRAQMQFEEPDEIMVTASFTMSVADWKRLLDQLPEGVAPYPALKFKRLIRQITEAAGKQSEFAIESE